MEFLRCILSRDALPRDLIAIIYRSPACSEWDARARHIVYKCKFTARFPPREPPSPAFLVQDIRILQNNKSCGLSVLSCVVARSYRGPISRPATAPRAARTGNAINSVCVCVCVCVFVFGIYLCVIPHSVIKRRLGNLHNFHQRQPPNS